MEIEEIAEEMGLQKEKLEGKRKEKGTKWNKKGTKKDGQGKGRP